MQGVAELRRTGLRVAAKTRNRAFAVQAAQTEAVAVEAEAAAAAGGAGAGAGAGAAGSGSSGHEQMVSLQEVQAQPGEGQRRR